MEKSCRSREGFTLIEVIVAVAILAVLSMPILLYFTNSAVHTAEGRHEQAADMAAQSIIEEIDSMDDFSSLENKDNLALTGDGWLLDDAYLNFAKPIAEMDPTDPTTYQTVLYRPISVNERTYMARVTLDYNAYRMPGGVEDDDFEEEPEPDPVEAPAEPTPESLFNSYEDPQLVEMHSESSVVIADEANVRTLSTPAPDSETDPFGEEEKSAYVETGIRNLYYKVNGMKRDGSADPSDAKISLKKIRDKASRSFYITVVKMSDERYQVNGGFRISYLKDGVLDPTAADTTDVLIYSTEVEKSKLSSIYFLFYPMQDEMNRGTNASDGIKADITFVDLAGAPFTPDNLIEFNFIWQKGGVSLPLTGYTISPAVNVGLGSVGNVSFHSNSPLVINTPDGNRSVLLDKVKKKRIAYVKVEIFNKDTAWSNPDTKALVTSTTSKALR